MLVMVFSVSFATEVEKRDDHMAGDHLETRLKLVLTLL